MKTIMIKDLSLTEELDRSAMASVHGGMHRGYFPSWVSVYDGSKHDFVVTAEQLNSQTQKINSSNGVNVAFAEGIETNITPSQDARNSISF